MIFALLVVGVIGLIIFKCNRWTTNRWQYFEERNLKYSGLRAGLPNLFRLLAGKIDFGELTKQMYNKFPDEK